MAVAVILCACATPPSGRYQFALAARDVQSSRVWSLDSLPRRGRIHLTAHTHDEAHPRQGTHVVVKFLESGVFPRAELDMNDPGCQGAYSFSLDHSTTGSIFETDYFDRRLPWGAPLEIRAEWWPDGRLQIEIGDVGKKVLDLRGAVRAFEIRLLSGDLQVDDLDYENLSSS